MKSKIFLGLAALAVVGLAGFSATQAFFSDTETSTANVFHAGTLTMQVAETNSGSANSKGDSTFTAWDNNDTLFSYADLIPGDTGTADWALKPTQNAWACVKPNVTGNSKDVAGHIEVAYWNDVNSNGEYNPGAGENINSFELADEQYYPIEDASGKVGSDGVSSDGSYRVGYAYCFGNFKRHSNGSLYIVNNKPVCDGSSVTNDQKNGVAKGDFEFYAEQMANNANFTCASLNADVVKDFGTRTASQAYTNHDSTKFNLSGLGWNNLKINRTENLAGDVTFTVNTPRELTSGNGDNFALALDYDADGTTDAQVIYNAGSWSYSTYDGSSWTSASTPLGIVTSGSGDTFTITVDNSMLTGSAYRFAFQMHLASESAGSLGSDDHVIITEPSSTQSTIWNGSSANYVVDTL